MRQGWERPRNSLPQEARWNFAVLSSLVAFQGLSMKQQCGISKDIAISKIGH